MIEDFFSYNLLRFVGFRVVASELATVGNHLSVVLFHILSIHPLNSTMKGRKSGVADSNMDLPSNEATKLDLGMIQRIL